MKFLKTVGITVVLSALLTSSVFAATKGTTNGNNINVRAAASTDSAIVKVVNSGTSFDIISLENNFLKVKVDGVEAFISAELLKLDSADGIINSESVNVRTSPSTDASVAGVVGLGTSVTAVGVSGEWVAISYNDKVSYIHKDYFTSPFTGLLKQVSSTTESEVVVSTYAIVNASGGLRLRSDASTDASVITTLANGEILDVESVSGEWVNISVNGLNGYVSSEFVEVRTGEKPSRSNVSGKGEQVISYAKQFIGTRYSWGGTNLNTGVDCSGFTYAVFANFGISLNRVAADQSRNGVRVSKSELAVGDLIFLDTSGGNNGEITHVGIYMGNGQFIHSSSGSAYGVVVSELNTGYYSTRFVAASRVLR